MTKRIEMKNETSDYITEDTNMKMKIKMKREGEVEIVK